MKLLKKHLFFFLLLCNGMGYGQNPIGLPDIVSYSRSDYNGGLQNRGIVQDKNGILFFANSEGLLSFDGTNWKLYPLPNKTIVRSVAVSADFKVYVGGQNEMGYFSPDENGNLFYTSLKSLLGKNESSFKDIWDIVPFQNKIFFRSQNKIFEYDGKKVTVFKPKSQWLFLGAVNNELYAQDVGYGLFKFTNSEWLPQNIANSVFSKLTITSLLPLNMDSILMVTLKGGLFVLTKNGISAFKFKDKSPFQNQLLLCAMLIDEKTVAIGTQLEGLYIINTNGNIVENLTRKEGLQNNTVLGLFLDKDHNLWIGLDDGIDFNAFNSAVKHIYPEKLDEGTGYSAKLFNNTLYIGTSNWLYELPLNGGGDLSMLKGEFKPVQNTKGPAWGLFSINNNLLLAHHEGAFQVNGDVALPINTRYGYWNFIPYNQNFSSDTIIAGNYNGLDFILNKNNAFKSTGNLNFNESSRYVIIKDKIAWVAHNYKGIFKIDLRQLDHPVVKLYNNQNGLPSLLKNRLFNIKNRMVVATEKGVYEYDEKSDAFIPSPFFRDIFKQKDIRYLKEDEQGNVWFIEEKKLGVVNFSGGSPKSTYFPELNGKLVSDFENIYPLNQENIFIEAEKGFYHLNYKQYKTDKSPIGVLLRLVKSSGEKDTTLYGGFAKKGFGLVNKLHKLSSKQNDLHFEYSAPSFQKRANIEYSYSLKNFDKGWSDWSKRTEKDYTNLPDGNYTFQIKARGNTGNESAITAYSFIILPPWYKTTWAFVLYASVLFVFNWLFFNWLRIKFRKEQQKYDEEQKRLKYLHQLEMEKSEKEIIALKNEKLESEILGKNSELAAVAMHLLQKSQLLAKIKEELVHLRSADDGTPTEELKKLIRILNQETKMDKDWEQFAGYFDNTHSGFLKNLKETHPLLTAHELKLCAYLRMNLSSKEIAQLLNISVRGVEISRYRLRKKLQLATEVNLYNYFTEFK